MMLVVIFIQDRKGHELTNEERSELVILINLVKKREILEWIDSQEFNMSSLYMYIRAKAAKEEDFF